MRYLVHRYRRSPQFQHRRRRRFAHRLVPHQHADRDPAHRRSSPAHPYAVLVAHDVARPPQVGGVDLTGGRRIPLPRQPAAQRPQSNHGAQVGGGCGSRFPVERHPGRLADLHLSRIHFQPQQAHAFPGRVSEREQVWDLARRFDQRYRVAGGDGRQAEGAEEEQPCTCQRYHRIYPALRYDGAAI